jgi:hypothetical protein
MANERRENLRLPVELDAVLNFEQHAIICTIRDMSPKGAFLETPPEELPVSSAPIEIGFTVNAKGESLYYRLPARIRRLTNNGVGISFGEVGLDDYFNLVDLVYPA